MNVIHDYITATPQFEHHVLRTERPGHNTGSQLGLDPSRITLLPRGPAAAILAIGRAVHKIQPTIVHAHSSIAGAYVRLCPLVRTRSIYYTPHCFAFERLDLPEPLRYSCLLVERLLARRTKHFVAVSGRELDLARRLNPAVGGTYVPNIASLPPALIGHHSRRSLTVATIGRVSEQKDPVFFAEIVRAARDIPGVRWLWLGDGPDHLTDPLRAAGVQVSGWLPRDAVLEHLASAAVYVHTASWEGSPLAILEAATVGLPMVIRMTPATVSLEIDNLVATPAEAAQAIRLVVATEFAEADHRRFLSRHSIRTQIETLASAYCRVAPEVALMIAEPNPLSEGDNPPAGLSSLQPTTP